MVSTKKVCFYLFHFSLSLFPSFPFHSFILLLRAGTLEAALCASSLNQNQREHLEIVHSSNSSKVIFTNEELTELCIELLKLEVGKKKGKGKGKKGKRPRSSGSVEGDVTKRGSGGVKEEKEGKERKKSISGFHMGDIKSRKSELRKEEKLKPKEVVEEEDEPRQNSSKQLQFQLAPAPSVSPDPSPLLSPETPPRDPLEEADDFFQGKSSHFSSISILSFSSPTSSSPSTPPLSNSLNSVPSFAQSSPPTSPPRGRAPSPCPASSSPNNSATRFPQNPNPQEFCDVLEEFFVYTSQNPSEEDLKMLFLKVKKQNCEAEGGEGVGIEDWEGVGKWFEERREKERKKKKRRKGSRIGGIGGPMSLVNPLTKKFVHYFVLCFLFFFLLLFSSLLFSLLCFCPISFFFPDDISPSYLSFFLQTHQICR